MTCPIYVESGVPEVLSRDAHAGLWWDKFFNGYTPNWSLRDDGKSNWIQTVSGKRGSTSQLKRFVQRQYELGLRLSAGQKVLQTHWHFATGLGLSHPVENGFAWHPTLGVPYLPGSGVKGLLRAWVEQWQFEAGQEQQRDARIRQWFGGDQDDEAAGSLIFFDAIPVEPVELAPDVMTPHMGKWYEQGGQIDGTPADASRVPADWHSPVPVVFLVVKQANFLFQIAPRGHTALSEANQAMQQLQLALEFLGSGAKTAVGYGRMSENVEALQRLQEEQQKLDAKLGKLLTPQPVRPIVEPPGNIELEIVTLIEPLHEVVQIQAETGEVVECLGIGFGEAQAKWQSGVRECLALVTRRNGIAVKALWQE